MMLNKVTLLLFGILCVFASATQLSVEMRLRKLSLHLRGFAPTVTEFKALETALKSGQVEKFFQEKTTQYLKSPQHVGKMIGRLNQLFRLRSAQGLPETRLLGGPLEPFMAPGSETLNALDLLGAEIVQKNLSWDLLLTTRQYPLYSRGPGSDTTDGSFLSVVAPEVLQQEKGYFTFPVPEKDLRFAGVLTTGRFFSRYSTTNLNRNRGRAAAIFRIFLCDDMKAVVEPSAEEEEELLKKAFPPKPGPDGYHNRLWLAANDDPHGSQESCRACHYKLDPLGKTFITSGSLLSEEPAPGTLVFKRADGTLVDIKGRGIAELATAIVTQPEYARCQVTHFWRWFIRGDRMPSEKRLAELVREFEGRGRRPNDFIAYLVNEPEFYKDESTAIPTLLDVKPLLGRCNGCHSGLTTISVPSFTEFPMGGDEGKHLAWVERIVERLDLANDGKERTMPPKQSAWQPTSDDIRLIKAWVAGGARNESGGQTIDEKTAQDLLKLSGPFFAKSHSGFRDTFKRYLSIHDIFRQWREKFPRVPFDQNDECQRLDDKNRAPAGDPNPFNGELVYQGPSSAFVKWYGKCLITWVSKELEAAYSKDMRPFFGQDAAQILEAAGLQGVIKDPKATTWLELPPGVGQKIILHLVHEYIGPGIVTKEHEYTGKLATIAQATHGRLPVFEVFKKLLFILGTQDEFLTY